MMAGEPRNLGRIYVPAQVVNLRALKFLPLWQCGSPNSLGSVKI